MDFWNYRLFGIKIQRSVFVKKQSWNLSAFAPFMLSIFQHEALKRKQAVKCLANKKSGKKWLLDVAILEYWAQMLSTRSSLTTHSGWTHPAVTDGSGTIPNCTSAKSLVSESIQCNSPDGKERKHPPKSSDRKEYKKGNWCLAMWSIYWKKTKTQITLALSKIATACHRVSVLKTYPT